MLPIRHEGGDVEGGGRAGGRRKEEGDNEAADKEGVFKTRPHSDTSLDWNRP